ncbi:MAG: tail fiber protein [Leptolyngbyaceae cyanobacterium MO_188.B28]|nr:tail fiber protein [Leptolyngbyaceae cyanobacterium MO_188.B28]
MSEPYLSQITIVGFNFAPRGYAFCDGQILPINQNQSLFALLGTTFGGDGRTSFALPDLRGRVPIHFGAGAGLPNYRLGQQGGEETHSLAANEMPSHTHAVGATDAAATKSAPKSDRILGQSTDENLYGGAVNLVPMDSRAVTNTGGGQAQNNMMPFLTISFCIALQGTFPSRN